MILRIAAGAMIVAALALAPGNLGAADYYMAVGGSDGNAGTIDAPWQTFAAAVPRLGPGDTLFVRAGTYAEAINAYDFDIPEGESWDRAVTLAAYEGETVVIRPDAGSDVMRFMGTQYVIVRGFVLDASNVDDNVVKITYGSAYYSAHHIRLTGCEVMNAPGQGILVGSEGSTEGYNEFIGLDVHDNGTTDFDHGLYIGDDYNLVEGCRIHHNAGWGVHIYNGYEGETADHNIVRGNLVYENAAAGDRGVGIGLYTGTGNAAYNNVVWSNRIGIALNYGLVDAAVMHNTVYESAQDGISVGDGSTNAEVRNNIVYLSGWSDVSDGGAGTSLGINLQGTDPVFVDAAGRDFHLREESPAVDAGEPVAEVAVDFDGVPRPQGEGYDLGAYEYHAGPIAEEGLEPAPEDGGEGEIPADLPVEQGEPGADASVDAPVDAGEDGGNGDGGDEGCGCRFVS